MAEPMSSTTTIGWTSVTIRLRVDMAVRSIAIPASVI